MDYKGRHEKTWQEPRYFGKHESWVTADDAGGYGAVPSMDAFEILRTMNATPIQRNYYPRGEITFGTGRRVPIIRQVLMRDRRPIIGDLPRPYGPFWERAPQAAQWLPDRVVSA